MAALVVVQPVGVKPDRSRISQQGPAVGDEALVVAVVVRVVVVALAVVVVFVVVGQRLVRATILSSVEPPSNATWIYSMTGSVAIANVSMPHFRTTVVLVVARVLVAAVLVAAVLVVLVLVVLVLLVAVLGKLVHWLRSIRCDCCCWCCCSNRDCGSFCCCRDTDQRPRSCRCVDVL